MSTNSVMDTSKRRRHRSWPEALKREIVAATLTPGSSVSVVGRRYDVNANQVFAWRRRYRDTEGGAGRAAIDAGDGDAGPAGRDAAGGRERADRDRVERLSRPGRLRHQGVDVAAGP